MLLTGKRSATFRTVATQAIAWGKRVQFARLRRARPTSDRKRFGATFARSSITGRADIIVGQGVLSVRPLACRCTGSHRTADPRQHELRQVNCVRVVSQLPLWLPGALAQPCAPSQQHLTCRALVLNPAAMACTDEPASPFPWERSPAAGPGVVLKPTVYSPIPSVSRRDRVVSALYAPLPVAHQTWQQVLHPASGRTYFFNIERGVVSWDTPTAGADVRWLGKY